MKLSIFWPPGAKLLSFPIHIRFSTGGKFRGPIEANEHLRVQAGDAEKPSIEFE